MLARALNGSDRKSAAQRSRDLFATIAGGADRQREPALAVSRIRNRRGPDAVSEASAPVEVNESMSVTHLTVVPPPEAKPEAEAASTSRETTAARIRRLQAEAQALARDEVTALERKISELAQAARAIAEGGDAYHVGAREVARRLAEELPRQAGVLEALLRKL